MPAKKIYKTPGVFIEEISKFPPSVAAVETAIPAFVGYTERADKDKANDLRNTPFYITSMLEYRQYFGGPRNEAGLVATLSVVDEKEKITIDFSDENPASKNNMYYAMEMFFANGGGPCYIVSVGAQDGNPAMGTLVTGMATLKTEDEPTLIVCPEAVNASGDYGSLVLAALDQCVELQDRFCIFDVASTGDVNADATAFRDAVPVEIERRKYGASYYPYIRTALNYSFEETAVNIVDGRAEVAEGEEAPTMTLASIKETENDLYNRIKAKLLSFYVVLPPSSTIAGIYATVDNNRGVWKSPANVTVGATIEPTLKLTDLQQDGLNVHANTGKSINAIRSFTGKGTLVWGARTLAGNDNEWRYVSVRRFFNMVEESVKKATSRFVFEPNDANTWVKVRSMIENFLIVQWRAGALTGAKPEQAFYVKVGLNQTMSAEDILNGYLIVEIGMAVVRPAEFIVLQFSHKMQEA